MLLLMVIGVAVARLLPEELYGVFGTVGAVQGTLMLAVAFGFEHAATNFLSRHAANTGIISYLLRQFVGRRMALIAASMGLMALLAVPIARWQHVEGFEWAVRGMALFGVLSSLGSLITFCLIALFDVKANAVMRAVGLAVQLGLAVWLIKAGYGLAGAIWAAIAGQAVFVAGVLWPVGRRMIPRPEPVPFRPVVKFGLGLWVNDLMNQALNKQLGLLMLGFFAVDTAYRGYFNAAFNARVIADTLLLGGLGGTALAAASRLAEAKGREGLAVAWRLNVRITTFLGAPSLLFFAFQAERTMTILFGDKYAPATPVFVWLALFGLVGRVYGGGAHSTVMSAGGMVPIVVRQYVIGGLASIVLCYVGLMLFGSDPMHAQYAVSAGIGIGAIIVSALGFRVVRRAYGVRFPTVYTAKIVGAGLLAGLTTLWLPLGEWWDGQRLLVRVLLTAALAAQYMAVFYAIIRLLRPFSAEDFEAASKASRRVTKLIRPLVGEPIPEPDRQSGA